ncbi:MAG TPA: type II toxin-antitoxin system ParD family antitoxin [Stellaceae bacterium]|nr:type II toxin-antitoxin system ParD family antitoxin [Stellaceae bacterium]
MDGAMTTNVSLTPELERFARECVEEGRYNNVSEVVRSGLRLLQEQEELRRQLTAMMHEIEEQADQGETYTLEEVLAEMDEIIEEAENEENR